MTEAVNLYHQLLDDSLRLDSIAASTAASPGLGQIRHMAVGHNQWYHFAVGELTTHFRLPILVVGQWGCSLGANRFGF